MRIFLSLLLFVSPLLSTCSTLRAVQQRRRRSRLGFFEARPDFRLCAFPFCGGSFLKPIDGSMITCPGSTEGPTAECYVASMRYPATVAAAVNGEPGAPFTPFNETLTPIVYGRIVPGNYPGDMPMTTINDFVVRSEEWFVAAATQRPLTLDYTVQRDYRKCAAPLCGGYWITSTTTAQTLCADGTVSDVDAPCYVANLNLSSSSLDPDSITITDGSTVRGYYVENPIYSTTSWPDLRDLYVLQVDPATAATTAAAGAP
jgi:hypothetical protein